MEESTDGRQTGNSSQQNNKQSIYKRLDWSRFFIKSPYLETTYFVFKIPIGTITKPLKVRSAVLTHTCTHDSSAILLTVTYA
jgi:hypothetical protein